jgi:exodeoxyribonuclease VII large subunit
MATRPPQSVLSLFDFMSPESTQETRKKILDTQVSERKISNQKKNDQEKPVTQHVTSPSSNSLAIEQSFKPQPPGQPPFTVTQFFHIIKGTLENAFPTSTRIIGEVSSFITRSGHAYIELKDARHTIRLVMWGARFNRLTFPLKQGLEVIVTGKVTAYGSNFQVDVERIEPVGVGALELQFEALKNKLLDEGLFSTERKKPLPLVPRQVGIVTSLGSSVLRDVVKVVRARFPSISILVSPTRVQGNEAHLEVAQALTLLDQSQQCDVILLVRGGGSREELWTFNEETVARAISQCKTPVISGIGHETDTTIADFVADRRAATPSQAAEIAIPSYRELVHRLDNLANRLLSSIRRSSSIQRTRLLTLKDKLLDPRVILMGHRQQLSLLEMHLDKAMQQAILLHRQRFSISHETLQLHRPDRLVQRKRLQLTVLQQTMTQHAPLHRIARHRMALQHLKNVSQRSLLQNLQKKKVLLQKNAYLLDALSPLQVLHRGYGLITSPLTGDIIKDSSQLSPQQSLHIRFSRGTAFVSVQTIHSDTTIIPNQKT